MIPASILSVNLNENQATRYLKLRKLIFIHNSKMIVWNWHSDQLISIIKFGINQDDAPKQPKLVILQETKVLFGENFDTSATVVVSVNSIFIFFKQISARPRPNGTEIKGFGELHLN